MSGRYRSTQQAQANPQGRFFGDTSCIPGPSARPNIPCPALQGSCHVPLNGRASSANVSWVPLHNLSTLSWTCQR